MHIIGKLTSNHDGFDITPIARAFADLADRVYLFALQAFEYLSQIGLPPQIGLTQSAPYPELLFESSSKTSHSDSTDSDNVSDLVMSIPFPRDYSEHHLEIHTNLLEAMEREGLTQVKDKLGGGGFGGVYLMTGSKKIKLDHGDNAADLAIKILDLNKIIGINDKGNFVTHRFCKLGSYESEGAALNIPKGIKGARAYGVFVVNPDTKVVTFVTHNTPHRYQYKDCIVIATVSRAQKEDLNTAVNREKASPKKIKELEKQALDAMINFHDQGYIHADIKPQNFLVKEDGINVKLTDFGFATKEKVTNRKRGTLGFAAPEVMNGEFYTKSADVYSYGKMLLYNHTKSFNVETPNIKDENLHHLLFNEENGLLSQDPNKRCSESRISAHPYFTSVTGL